MTESTFIHEAVRGLAAVRGRQCLLLNNRAFDPGTVRAVREAIGGHDGPLDVVLWSGGGCTCCVYAGARELHRRFDHVAVFVPLPSRSASTMLALAADELVLGDLGELGPLDAQFSEKQRADFPIDRSRLELLRALEHLKALAAGAVDEMVRSIAESSGLRGEDVYRVATDFASRLLQPISSQIDPQVAESEEDKGRRRPGRFRRRIANGRTDLKEIAR